MKVNPTARRSVVSSSTGKFEIVIPSRKNWLLILIMGFWLCGWAAGEVMVPTQFLGGKMKDPGCTVFVLAWLGAWTVGGGFAIYAGLWNVAGREVVSFSSQTLAIRREVFGVGRTQEFDIRNIRGLRVAAQSFNPMDFRYASYLGGLGVGTISFDYGAKTYRFGNGLDEAEAKILVGDISERFKIPT